jgi:hypothetical protein
MSTDQVLLVPNQRALLQESGKISVTSLDNQKNTPPWVNNLLMFSSTPLRLVFDEIERQYGIKIVTPKGMQFTYSGNFALDGTVENVLTLLCRPFDLLYENKSGNTYNIYPAD